MVRSGGKRVATAHAVEAQTGEDIVAAYLAELNEKYGLEPSEPLSDELVDLLVRLKALKRSGGYRSS